MNANYAMERRIGARVRTDLNLKAYRDGRAVHCRAVDLSPGGVLVRRGGQKSVPMVQRIELDLGKPKPLRAMARTVWRTGDLQAMHFVGMNDVDRLEIAQHLDRVELERRFGRL